MTALPDGWLSEDEAVELARLAAGKVVLELGSYLGRSTVVLAGAAERVVSIDLHRPFTFLGELYPDTFEEYFANVRDLDNVVSIVGPFTAARLFYPDAFDLVFVDGVHDYDNARDDLGLAFEFEATIAAHDWGRYDLPQVAHDFDLRPGRVVDSLAVWHEWERR